MIGKLLRIALPFAVIVPLALGIILYSKGYRINLRQKTVQPTGILSASSSPDRSSVWINGVLTTATNASVSLAPDWYNVKISKEGYQSWEKNIRVEREIVSQADALLIPSNPSFRAKTVTGITNQTISPSGNLLAYIIPKDNLTSGEAVSTKSGVWVYDLRNASIFRPSQLKQIFANTTSLNLTNTTIRWSWDEKELILLTRKKVGKTDVVANAFLLSTTEENTIPKDITGTEEKLFSVWNQKLEDAKQIQLLSIPPSVSAMIQTASSSIHFSPDDTKILYLATRSATLPPIITPPLIGANSTKESRNIEPGKYYIFDVKEDKNFLLTDTKMHPTFQTLTWYSDSKHIVMIENNTIYIIDYDGTNKRSVYSGPFDTSLLLTFPDNKNIGIFTSFNNPQELPNLYEIDLR